MSMRNSLKYFYCFRYTLCSCAHIQLMLTFKIEHKLFCFSNDDYYFLKEFLFDPTEDLMNLKDIPKVTRCLALMAKMVNNTYKFSSKKIISG